jgi:putative ABC transport system permease protein
MEAENITYFSLVMMFLLVIPIIILNVIFKLRINKRMLYAIARMGIQLTLVGVYLQYIFEFNQPVVNVLYIVAMILVAAFSIVKSTGLDYKRILLPMFISMLVPMFTVVLFFNAVVINISNLFEAKYLISIGGMVLGNCLTGIIVGVNSFYQAMKENEREYLYTLSLGASRFQALTPYFRQALYATINPTIASMATIGLVALPGMMTGQILGGSVPFVAIKYQIAIMLAILIGKYFSIIFALYFTSKKLFNEYDVFEG